MWCPPGCDLPCPRLSHHPRPLPGLAVRHSPCAEQAPMLRSEDIGDPEGGTGEGPVQVAQPTTNNGGNGSNRGQTPADSVPLIPVHPLGVKPLGNQYFSSVVPARRSLGQLVALPDEMILQILESLQAHDLLNVGVSCVFLFAFSRLDELWKSLYLE